MPEPHCRRDDDHREEQADALQHGHLVEVDLERGLALFLPLAGEDESEHPEGRHEQKARRRQLANDGLTVVRHGFPFQGVRGAGLPRHQLGRYSEAEWLHIIISTMNCQVIWSFPVI